MELNVNIDPEEINRIVSEGILKSSIGKHLTEAIDKQVKTLSQGYNNPIEPVVAAEIQTVLRTLVRENYNEKIKELVVAKLEKELNDELVTRLWEALMSQIGKDRY